MQKKHERVRPDESEKYGVNLVVDVFFFISLDSFFFVHSSSSLPLPHRHGSECHRQEFTRRYVRRCLNWKWEFNFGNPLCVCVCFYALSNYLIWQLVQIDAFGHLFWLRRQTGFSKDDKKNRFLFGFWSVYGSHYARTLSSYLFELQCVAFFPRFIFVMVASCVLISMYMVRRAIHLANQSSNANLHFNISLAQNWLVKIHEMPSNLSQSNWKPKKKCHFSHLLLFGA